MVTINKLNEEIESLHYLNNEQNDKINSLLIEKSNMEAKLKEIEAQDKAREKEMEKIKAEHAKLLKYKENYEKIIGFLATSENKTNKK